MNPKVIVLVGPSCSGKSSWSAEFLNKNPDYMRVNRDDIRRMLRLTTYLDGDGERLVLQIQYDMAMSALMAGNNVLLDNTHCRLSIIQEIIRHFEDVADIEFVAMPQLSFKELQQRNLQRHHDTGWAAVPDFMLKRHYDDFQSLQQVFDFAPRPKKVYECNNSQAKSCQTK